MMFQKYGKRGLQERWDQRVENFMGNTVKSEGEKYQEERDFFFFF